jgi:hypothetical protein
MNNFKTHKSSALYESFVPEEAKRIRDRFEFIYTHKHGSWLNMAEIELHTPCGQCLNRHIATKQEITKDSSTYREACIEHGDSSVSSRKQSASVSWQPFAVSYLLPARSHS